MPNLAPYETLRFQSSLPTIQRVIEAGGSDPGSLTGPAMRATAELARLVTGRAWLAQSKRQVAPAAQAAVKAFDGFVGGLEQLPAGAAVWASSAVSLGEAINDPSRLSEVVLAAQLSTVSALWARAASETPVLSMVWGFIALGVNVGRTIWAENAGAKSAGAPPLQLDPGEDTARGNELLDYLRADDWTPLFLPHHNPHVPTFVSEDRVEYGTGYKGGRFWLAGESGTIEPMGQGLIPGGGVARIWQYRGKQASTGSTGLDRILRALRLPIAAGVDFEAYTLYGIEYFRPAMEQVGQLVWAQCQQPGSYMFRLNVDRMRNAWERYWRHWIAVLVQMSQKKKPPMDAVRLVAGVLLGPGASWPDWPNAFNVPAVVSVVPEKYRDLLPYSLQPTGERYPVPGGEWVEERTPQLTGWQWWVTRRGTTRRFLDQLELAQLATLDTIEVAYLVGNEPALTGKVGERFKLRRTQLLDDSRALRALDWDRVPPGSWKTAARKKLLGGIKL